MDRQAFGELLRAARQRSLLTLEGLAEASGVSVRAISDMERGKSLPRRTTLSGLLDALSLEEEQRRRLEQTATRGVRQFPQQLPPDLEAFRGREEALKAVHRYTDQIAKGGGHVVVSALGGMAGVGKTALAVHWAHQAAGRFADGQLYVNLRGFEESGDPVDPGDALGGFLRALGVPSSSIPADTEARAALFRERTASRRLIVLLDNARATDQVRPLLPASPGCLTIITSRNHLSGLAVSEGALLIDLDVWSHDEALAALAARIGEARCRAESEAAGELVRLCGHLPLAVAILSAHLSTQPRLRLHIAVRELSESRSALDALATDDQRVDVRTVFSWSYNALAPDTARFFRHICLQPASTLSAQAAASLAWVEMTEARRHLRALTSASLVTRDAEGRYILHDLVRAYGAELAEQLKDDRVAAEIRLLDYLRHNAYAANRFVARMPTDLPDEPVPGVISIGIDNHDEGMHWYQQEEAGAAAALVALDDPRLLRHRSNVSLEWAPYDVLAGRWTEAITAARIGLDAALILDDSFAIVSSCRDLARARIETGRLDEAAAIVDLMVERLEKLQPRHRIRAERNAAWMRDKQGRHTDALQHARTAVAIARELDSRVQLANALSAECWNLTMVGEFQEALSVCREALSLLQEVGNRIDELTVWDTVGYAQHGLGDFDAAITSYGKALRIGEETRHDYYQAMVLDHQASTYLALGDIGQAHASWTRAAELLDRLHIARAVEVQAKADALPSPGAQPSD